MNALVNIHTASPGPSILPLPLGFVLVGSSLLIAAKRVSFKIEEFVGTSIMVRQRLYHIVFGSAKIVEKRSRLNVNKSVMLIKMLLRRKPKPANLCATAGCTKLNM